MLDWLRRQLLAPSAKEQEVIRAIESAQALLARGKAHAALIHLTGSPPTNSYLLASYVDAKIQAAMALRDLILLDGLAPHAQTLGQLRPEKGKFMMREAEAVGAHGLAIALAKGLAAAGHPADDDLARIEKKHRNRVSEEGYLTIARTSLGRDYEDIRLAGLGESSYVVSAKPKDREYRVAIKFLGPRSYLDDRGRQRFAREAALLNKIDHPSILRVFHYDDGEPPYMVIEFFPGFSLRQLLDQGVPFEAEKVCRVGIKLCDALGAAHAQGIIHRDVEPGNVLVDAEKVKLIDFGLARTGAWEVSAQGSVLGDWAYLAPEQYEATAAKPEVTMDVFGVGATLHHMLTGSPPYGRTNLIVRERTNHLDQLRGQVSGELLDTLEKALAHEVKDRWPGIQELGEGLRRAYLRGGKSE